MRVIAEAYGREPLDRELVGHQNGLCYLVTADVDSTDMEDTGRGVGFPERYVFSYDSDLLAALQSAFVSRDSERLDRLWAQAHALIEHV